MQADICWGVFYGPMTVVKSIAKKLKKHPMLYLDVEQFSLWEAKNLYSLTSDNPATRSSEEEIFLKRIYQDRDLNKLTEKDLREWFTIKIMGPSIIKTTMPKDQVREFAVYMTSGDDWLCDEKTGNRVMTLAQAESLIDSIFDEELVLMQVVRTVPARKSIETRVREAKEQLNTAMEDVQKIILRNDEASIAFMTHLAATLKDLKDKDANKKNVSHRDGS